MKIKIITVATVILLLVVMSVPVYADTLIPQRPSGGWEYWVVATENNGSIIYVTSYNPITVTPYILDPDQMTLRLRTYKIYRYEVDKWELISEDDEISNYHHIFKNIYQSNHDIAYEDGSGFFFLRPRVSHLYPTMREADSGTILRTFSVGLIPLIGCLILGISLVKAWGFLRTQLKH